jgi:cytochrome P450
LNFFGIVPEKSYNIFQKITHILISRIFSSSKLTCGGLSGMVNKMVKATTLVLDTWEQKVRNARGSIQLEINNDMRTITSHVISLTTFGNDYKEGQQMFQHMEALVQILAETVTNPFHFLPGFRFFLSFFSFHEDAIFHIVTCVHV